MLQLVALEGMLEALRMCLSFLSPFHGFLRLQFLSANSYPFPDTTSPFTSVRPPIPIYAQDPAFTPTDTAFLAAHNVKVLQPPSALAEVGPGTIIFAPHCARGVYLESLERLEPAIDDREDGDGGPHRGHGIVVGNDVEKLISG